MKTILDNFHLLRPEWLWALLPAIAFSIMLARVGILARQDNWTKHVDAHLLKYLSVSGKEAKASRLLPVAVFLSLCLLILGISGPSWEQTKQPTWQGGEPVVAVLSLAQSMNSNDVSPSRLRRASHKLKDVLQQTAGDEHGLVIYSDTPFIAAPLTSDPKVIEQMIPELSTSLMPVLGNRLDLAIDEASGLLNRANAGRGTILVLTDNIGQIPQASIEAAETARNTGYTVSVLGVGTQEGAKLQTASGQIITDRSGKAMTSQVDRSQLESLALAGGGSFAMLTASNSDLNQLLPASSEDPTSTASKKQDFQSDSWVDMGYWLLILPTFMFVFAFRRGWLFVLVLTSQSMLFYPSETMAAGTEEQPTVQRLPAPQTEASLWDRIWNTKDQLGQANFDSKNYQQAANLFEDSSWKAASLYKSGGYKQAVSEYSSLGQKYNQANALAKSGELKGALDLYNQVLKQHPDDEDARFNRDLIQELLKQQKQQQQKQQEQQNNNEKDKHRENQQDKSQSSEDQEAKDKSEKNQRDEQQNGSGNKQQPEPGEQDKSQEQSGSDAQNNQKQQSQFEQQAQSAQQNDPQAQEERQVKPQQGEQSEEAKESDEGLLSRLVSEALKGNSDDKSDEASSSPQPVSAEKVDQATEQELRRVPDDPSGLLRARIRQHYARLRAAQNQ